jgi:phosphatidylserine decarboxylase
MAEKLEDWIKNHVNKYKELPPEKIYNELFFRDEYRTIKYNPNEMYSPADGIIIYQKKVRKGEKIIEVKGINYTVEDILCNKNIEDTNYYVIGVFMTLYDVHINRVPTDGLLKYQQLPTITSRNMPMIFMEKDLFKGVLDYKKSDYNYLFKNERLLNTIIYNKKRITYHVVQIADLDVAVITPYSIDNPEFFNQGERFSFIRWGSQCDIVIPEHHLYDFEFLQKELYHVKAGIDPLIRIKKKDNR